MLHKPAPHAHTSFLRSAFLAALLHAATMGISIVSTVTSIVVLNFLGFLWARHSPRRPWDRAGATTRCGPATAHTGLRVSFACLYAFRRILTLLLLGFLHLDADHLLQNVLSLLFLAYVLAHIPAPPSGQILWATYLLGTFVGLGLGSFPLDYQEKPLLIGASAGVSAWCGWLAARGLQVPLSWPRAGASALLSSSRLTPASKWGDDNGDGHPFSTSSLLAAVMAMATGCWFSCRALLSLGQRRAKNGGGETSHRAHALGWGSGLCAGLLAG